MTQACIVISDTHFGSNNCNQKELCHFLEWIQNLNGQPRTIKCGDKDITITIPDKIILLGDIIDLWDPKNGDKYHILNDCMKPFYLLSEIDCDKIYILGNHDHALGQLDSKMSNITLGEGTRFYLYSKSYHMTLNKKSYVFIHGHQFDKLQAAIQFINRFWDPLGWYQEVFNIDFAKKYWKTSFLIFLGLLFTGKYFLWNNYLENKPLNIAIWAVITGFYALSSIPGIIARSQRDIYNTTRPADHTVEQVIKKRYYQKNKETQKADVVVFGHTHFAGSYEFELEKQLFLNSGCWVGEDTDFNGKMRYTNSFIYLDETGSYILTWRGNGKIDCIESFVE